MIKGMSEKAIIDLSGSIAAKTSDLDESCQMVQEKLGVTEGGIAGIFFSGFDPEAFSALSESDRLVHIHHYIKTELLYANTKPNY
mgnify:CR=1 FL=1